MAIRFVHTNLIARDWKCLADFYAAVFGCEPAGSARDLRGAWLDDATGIPNARIRGRHMRLPGYGSDGPTLEIFEYEPVGDRPEHAPNTPGFGHVAFAVDDIPAMADAIVQAGGRADGRSAMRFESKLRVRAGSSSSICPIPRATSSKFNGGTDTVSLKKERT